MLLQPPWKLSPTRYIEGSFREDFVSAEERLTSHEAQRDSATKEPSRIPGTARSPGLHQCYHSWQSHLILHRNRSFFPKQHQVWTPCVHTAGLQPGCCCMSSKKAEQPQGTSALTSRLQVCQDDTQKKYPSVNIRGELGLVFSFFFFFLSCSSIKVHLGLVFPAPRGQWALLLLFSGCSLAKHSSPIYSGKECLQQKHKWLYGRSSRAVMAAASCKITC